MSLTPIAAGLSPALPSPQVNLDPLQADSFLPSRTSDP